MNKIVALVGLSGVGKSTFISSLKDQIDFQYLSASLLIKNQKKLLQNLNLKGDDLRFGDINDNQKLLIDGFKKAHKVEADLTILDGHTVIDTPDCLIEIEPVVFKEIGVENFILLTETAEVISERRKLDQSRNRPILSVKELIEHQEISVNATAKAALDCRIPLLIVTSEQIKTVVNILKS